MSDITYNADDTVSNIFRHVKWFRPVSVKKGDVVIVYTREGQDGVIVEDHNKAKTYYFYWGSRAAVWNNAGDSATLFELADSDTKKVK